jgi:hypothetical protein
METGRRGRVKTKYQYRTVTYSLKDGDQKSKFEYTVELALKEGWILAGGIAIAFEDRGASQSQRMYMSQALYRVEGVEE